MLFSAKSDALAYCPGAVCVKRWEGERKYYQILSPEKRVLGEASHAHDAWRIAKLLLLAEKKAAEEGTPT